MGYGELRRFKWIAKSLIIITVMTFRTQFRRNLAKLKACKVKTWKDEEGKTVQFKGMMKKEILQPRNR
ncbi:hypothetical protein ILYODFUR_025137 [Ilyodon furcidens]|uniref:Uncharacterized protein n=1 Tax=Ilyodon furcidens TaxID=33524 RepID=A0ABV0U0A7_9TELE